MAVIFEWDAKKARANLVKHGVSPEEARTVFEDPQARIHDDPEHSDEEVREIVVGHSRQGLILLVCFTEEIGVIRIITARKPDRDERQNYEEKSLD